MERVQMTHDDIALQIDQITDIVESLFNLQKNENELLKRIMETVQSEQKQLFDLDSRLNEVEVALEVELYG